MNVEIFYLPFGGEGRHIRPRVLYDEEDPSDAEFHEHWQYVEEVAINAPSVDEALGKVWEQWNAGSGKESILFHDTHVRSMSAGDILRIDGDAYLVDSIGWRRLKHLDGPIMTKTHLLSNDEGQPTMSVSEEDGTITIDRGEESITLDTVEVRHLLAGLEKRTVDP